MEIITDTLIKDVIVNSFDKPYLSFSQEVFEALMELQNWNFEKIYNSEKANANYDKIEKCFTRLYYFYLEKLSEVNPKEEITKNNYILDSVEYVKEGSTWFLRVVIDKNGIIDVEDCVNVSNIINPIIDANDPIKENYILDVCSKE